MRAQLDMAHTFVDQCVLLLNDGELSPEDASTAKLLTSEIEGRAVAECVQLHGGAGYMDEPHQPHVHGRAHQSHLRRHSEIMKEIISRSLGLDQRKMHKRPMKGT